MTTGLLLVTILAFVAVVYWRPFRRVRSALGFDYLASTGHVFIALGCILGAGAGDPAGPVLESVAPIVAFVAGWVGFSSGMRFDLRVLRSAPARSLSVAFAPAVAAAVLVGGAGAGCLLLAGVPGRQAAALSFVLAAAGASAGPTLAAILRTRRAGRSAAMRPTLRLIEFAAGLADIPVVLLAVAGFALFRPLEEPVGPLLLLAAAFLGGILLALTTWLFLGGKAAAEDERMLLGLAMLAFTAGFAGWLHFSPAAVAAVVAMTLVNLPGERAAALFNAVRRVERTAVIILMTVVGYHMVGPGSPVLLPLLLALTALRLLAKAGAGDRLAVRTAAIPGMAAAPRWAVGLTPQGALALVVALSAFHVWRDDVSRSVLAAVALAGVLNEIAAPVLMLRVLRGAAAAAPPPPAGEAP